MSRHVSVREVMTTTPSVVDGLATVQEAIDIMRERGTSSVIVDRRERGTSTGSWSSTTSPSTSSPRAAHPRG